MTLRLTCTTCRARLKVVDPAALGQIVSCPKCGSMVEVIAPPGGLNEISAAAGVVVPTAAPQASVSRGGAEAMTPVSPADAAAAASSRWFWPTFGGVTVLMLAAAAMAIYLDRSHRAPAKDEVASSDPATLAAKVDPPVAPVDAPKIAPATDPPSKTLPVDPKIDPKNLAAPHPEHGAQGASISPDNKTAAPEKLPLAKSPVTIAPPSADKTAKAPPPAVAAVDKPPVDPHPAPPAVVRPTLERIPPRVVDVEARLADKLRGIEFPETPLFQFLADLSQMSTIPISLDADALAEMGLSPDATVSVSLKETTVAEALKEAIGPRGLGFRAVNQQLVVGRPPSDGLRSVRFSVADLAGDKAEGQKKFATLVETMVEPQSWQRAGGSGTAQWSEGAFLVEQDDATHARLLAFCERLRVARGLPLQAVHAGDRFQLTPRTAQAKALLSQKVTLQFDRPEPLSHILDFLRSTTHCNLLVDGPALAAERMSVETEGTAVAKSQPLGQSLTALLEPMELTFRVVDSRTIVVTTQRAADRHAEVEFYPVNELLISDGPGDALAQRVGKELTAAGPSDPPTAAPVIRFDEPSRSLIVRAPQSMQLRVQSLLNGWRGAAR